MKSLDVDIIKRRTTKIPKSNYLDESDYFAMRLQRNVVIGFCVALIVIVAFLAQSIGTVAKWSRPEPFLLRMDTKTGLTEIHQPYKPGDITIAEDTLYFESVISQYITKRERYYWFNFEADQAFVNAYSDNQAKATYKKQSNPDTPGSLPNMLMDKGVAEIDIKSIQRNGTLFIVRWQIRLSKDGENFNKPLPFISSLNIKLGDPPKTPKFRFINPFGVKIYNYKADKEV